jgi:histidine ammonia-lyase
MGQKIVRVLVKPLEEDRVLADDIRTLSDAIANGHFNLSDAR